MVYQPLVGSTSRTTSSFAGRRRLGYPKEARNTLDVTSAGAIIWFEQLVAIGPTKDHIRRTISSPYFAQSSPLFVALHARSYSQAGTGGALTDETRFSIGVLNARLQIPRQCGACSKTEIGTNHDIDRAKLGKRMIEFPRLALATAATGPEPSLASLAMLAGLTQRRWRVQHFRTRRVRPRPRPWAR